ncbi:MAG TPA: exonuclease domain-containing protein [Symbiobacteriaceae bacterium]|nr:exonuclease domain-containing protein [Symbiobacteriaceae bacterium]
MLIHGSFAPDNHHELTEIAALGTGQGSAAGYASPIQYEPSEIDRGATSASEVFAHLDKTFSLGNATVVMWGSTAYRCHAYAREKGLFNPCFQTRVIDLQAAVAIYLDLKTSDCKSARNVVRVLNLAPQVDCWSAGSLAVVHAMHAILAKLEQTGWRPEATPAAITQGADIGLDVEEMRIERWEQIRDRQNNLGIERRPLPEVTPAFILIDAEYASFRHERFSRLIEVGMVVAQRTERSERATYELISQPFTSLVQLERVEETNPNEWEITGIDREAVRRAPALPVVMAEMVAAAPWETSVLVSWGPDDARLITQNCVKAGIRSPITAVPLVDLQRAFAGFYDLGRTQVSLQNAASFLGIDTDGLDLHRALADAEVTWRVLERMLADGWTPHFRTWHRRQALVSAGYV